MLSYSFSSRKSSIIEPLLSEQEAEAYAARKYTTDVEIMDTVSDVPSSHKADSYLKATVFINLFAILCTIDSSVFKVIAFEGVRVIDYTAVEGVTTLISTSFLLLTGAYNGGKRINPFCLTEFPRELYFAMFLRMLMAQLAFFLNNICLTLIPFTLLVIIF